MPCVESVYLDYVISLQQYLNQTDGLVIWCQTCFQTLVASRVIIVYFVFGKLFSGIKERTKECKPESEM